MRGIVRSEEKAAKLREMGIGWAIADAHDRVALTNAFKGGTTLFVLTPESGKSADMMAETREILSNYRHAALLAGIRRIVGLSSMGAQYVEGTGNLKMSYLLEHAFRDTAIGQVFIRPAYYYSNWLPGIQGAREQGVLYDFFPDDLAIPMISPMDVATFATELILQQKWTQQVYEIEGPEKYSPLDVSRIASDVIRKKLHAQQIPKEKWPDQRKQMGFTADSARNFIEMTDAVITKPLTEGKDPVKGKTTLKKWLETAMAV